MKLTAKQLKMLMNLHGPTINNIDVDICYVIIFLKVFKLILLLVKEINKMPKKQILIVTTILITLLMPQVVMATWPTRTEDRIIRKIIKNVNTSEKKAAAVVKLISIVKDEKASILLISLAAEKLGQFRAVEARDMLKTIADSIEWTDTKRVRLKRITSLAYWQIRVTQEPTKELQDAMLIELLDVVPDWAIDELSNRGVKSALPKIIKRINYQVSGKSAEARIKLCTTKIDLLTNNFTRHEALYKAIVMEDTTDQNQRLRYWAIEELGKLDSTESGQILVYFAKALEMKYFDSDGKRISPKGDKLSLEADYLYNTIIKKLKCKGLSKDKIKAHGLNPNKVFLLEGITDEDCGCD